MGQLVTTLQTAFAGRRVLVIGDTGFKGSWLCLTLLELGAEVAGYALPPESDSAHFSLLGLDQLIAHHDGDIRDLPPLQKIFNQFQPEYVLHLAAQALVRRSYSEPKLTFDTNVGGSVNVLECILQTPSIRAAIYVTSDKCYLNKEWTWGYRENDELGGHDPYSASKAAAELVLAAYQTSFFAHRENFGIASVRAGNVIGGGDWAQDRIVPDCIRALVDKRPIILRSPDSTRPWQHVLDPLSGYLQLAAALVAHPGSCYGGGWNFGPRGDSIRTVQDLAESIVACWGEGQVCMDTSGGHLHEARLLHLNCDRAMRDLAWHPRWNFERTVKETAAWYLAVAGGAPAIDISRRQVLRYLGGQDD
jgi:CDP-glucose 4,6-dehydratase